MWLTAPNIHCSHGFSTRHGGVSREPFNSLNLGGSQDEPKRIAENRQRALHALQLDTHRVATLRQVHGTVVCAPAVQPAEGDALVTNETGWALAVSAADCYPLLFHDKTNGVIGAAHAGWRGTVAGIAANVLTAMTALGAERSQVQVAIGQGICKQHFEVGNDVIEQFEAAGFPQSALTGGHIDLQACNSWLLQRAGVPERNIWCLDRCTFEEDFFSYRRDGGLTGRMWGLIALS